MMRIQLGYPNKAQEIDVLGRQASHHPINDLEQAVSVEDLFYDTQAKPGTATFS